MALLFGWNKILAKLLHLQNEQNLSLQQTHQKLSTENQCNDLPISLRILLSFAILVSRWSDYSQVADPWTTATFILASKHCLGVGSHVHLWSVNCFLGLSVIWDVHIYNDLVKTGSKTILFQTIPGDPLCIVADVRLLYISITVSVSDEQH